MEINNIINEIRAFIAAAIRQFESQGIYIERVMIKRDESGKVTDISLAYEDRREEPCE